MRSAKDKDKYKRDKGFQDEDLCPGEGVMKEENFLHARKNPTSRARGSFRTSEWGATAGAQKAKQRKFNTEITAEQHFPAKKQLAHLCQQQRMGAGCWGSGMGVRSQGEDQGWKP